MEGEWRHFPYDAVKKLTSVKKERWRNNSNVKWCSRHYREQRTMHSRRSLRGLQSGICACTKCQKTLIGSGSPGSLCIWPIPLASASKSILSPILCSIGNATWTIQNAWRRQRLYSILNQKYFTSDSSKYLIRSEINSRFKLFMTEGCHDST